MHERCCQPAHDVTSADLSVIKLGDSSLSFVPMDSYKLATSVVSS